MEKISRMWANLVQPRRGLGLTMVLISAAVLVLTASCQVSTAVPTSTVMTNPTSQGQSSPNAPVATGSPTVTMATPVATLPINPLSSVSAVPATTATLSPPATSTASATVPQGNSALLTDAGADFAGGKMDGVNLTDDGLRITDSQGQFTSVVQSTAFAFDNAVLSWAADVPAGTSLKLDLRVQCGQSWSRWYTMGTWTNGHGASVSGQSDALGKVNVDTLELHQTAQAVQYRVTMSSSQPGVSPTLRSVSVAYADMSQPLAGKAVAEPSGWGHDLPVPQISQAVQDPAIRWEICSPTSLTMVLNYYGENKSLLEVVDGVRDQTTGIYGDWPFNTAYAATLGFDAHVARFYGLESLENEIAQGRPVIVSINFSSGQLDNVPISSTSGHLIVVRGFTANGDVIVNDPASPSNDTVRRVYPRDQFANVWLSSGGIAYVLVPENQ